jgi:hypothetical protein
MSDICHVRWQITWQSNGFNVSIPSCTGELGSGEERNLAEGEDQTEVLQSWCEHGTVGRTWQRRGAGLGSGEEMILADLEASEAWQRGNADWSLEVLDDVCPTGSFIFLASLRRRHMRSWWCGSCLEYSFCCLERLFSFAVCDKIMSVMKIIWCHKSFIEAEWFSSWLTDFT